MWPTGKHVTPREELLEIWKPYGILDTDVTEFMASMEISVADQKTIMATPQRSDKWHEYRAKRMTASNFGSIVGVNPYASPKSALKNMLWPRKFSCAATEWGTKYEDTAAKIFQTQMIRNRPELGIASVQFPGLIISPEKPYFGCSPDGIVVMKSGKRRGLEIKCPFSKKLYPAIPAYYYAQIQGTCGLLNLEAYYFAVWTPQETLIEEYAFDRDYYFQFLLPRMETFYFEEYVPLAILKHKGLLAEGSIVMGETLIADTPEEEPETSDASTDPPPFLWELPGSDVCDP